MFGKNMEIRTAASAAVQCGAEGQEGVWKVVSWAVPDNVDQTSVVAENSALLLAVRHCSLDLHYTIYADCMAGILGYQQGFCDLKGRVGMMGWL